MLERSLARRKSRERAPANIQGQPLLVDGLNVLTTIEAGLAGGILLLGRDGCCRDMAGMRGHYKRVTESSRRSGWPVSRWRDCGSPRSCGSWTSECPIAGLAGWIRDAANENAWNWRVEVVANPDPILSRCPHIAASADSMILDRCEGWFNLAREIVAEHVPEARVLDFAMATEAVTSQTLQEPR